MSFRRMRHVKAREFQGCDIAYDFSNPANLYDATSGGSLVAADGAIARANDVSGGSGHMTQSNSTYRPLRKVAALNGMDVARFDGSNDYLTAGDVGDMGTSPVECFVVVKHTSTSGSLNSAIFGKVIYTNTAGRWDLSSYNGLDRMISTATGLNGGLNVAETTQSTALQVLHGVVPRTAGTNANITTLRRNGSQIVASAGSTDPQDNNTQTYPVYVGACPNSGGTAPQAGTYLNGDVGEAAKYAALFTSAQRRRLELSRCRKWRLAS